MSKKAKSVVSDYEDMMKLLQKQPGIDNLMKTYGRYNNIIRNANSYYASIRPKSIISSSNSTA